jgi:diguanylate cyclase (GGDEF)-like protein
LPNRAPLGPTVDRQLGACRRNGKSLAVLSISLDSLEAVKQRYGHAVQNQVLHAAWKRLRSRLRASDLAVRVGSDEFGAILLEAAGPAAAVVDARLTDLLSEPYRIGALEIGISVCTGVAVYPQAGSTGEALAGAATHARLIKEGMTCVTAPGPP